MVVEGEQVLEATRRNVPVVDDVFAVPSAPGWFVKFKHTQLVLFSMPLASICDKIVNGEKQLA